MQRQSERGAVALVTTILISLLLAIITTGLISTMSSELRQQDDSEQSTLAYYAAQSGVEDAVSKIQTKLAAGLSFVQPVCDASNANMNLDNNGTTTIGWTCQLILDSSNPSGSLPLPDQAIQVDPGNSTYDAVTISWDTSASTAPPYLDPPLGAFSASGYNYAPPLELAIVQYPFGPFKAGGTQVITRNALLLPSTSGAGATIFGALAGGNPVRAHCVAAASYHCSVTISGLVSGGANNFLFRLRSRYVGTNYRMIFTSGGAAVPVPDGTATVDVTAKAGVAFRRVIYKVPYKQGAALGLDYVIYSDSNICKDFTFLNGALQNGSSCP